MPLVSVTRLRLRAVRFLPFFAWRTWRSARQARRSDGFLGGMLAGGPGRAFWTITVWRDEAAMRAYRLADSHGSAMPKLLEWCDEAAMAHWEQPGAALPPIADAARGLGERGRVSKVRHPSPAHAQKKSWPDGKVPPGGTRLVPVNGGASRS